MTKIDKAEMPADVIRNPNRVEKRPTQSIQTEYDRLRVTPNVSGLPLITNNKRQVKVRSAEVGANTNFVISRAQKKIETVEEPVQEYNSNIGAGGFPAHKKLYPINTGEMFATLDGTTSWDAGGNDTDSVIERDADEATIDNNEFIDVESLANGGTRFDRQVSSGTEDEPSKIETQIDHYVLSIKGSLVLSDATYEEVQSSIESIIYGEHDDFKDIDLKASDFHVYKRVGLYFGVSINK